MISELIEVEAELRWIIHGRSRIADGAGMCIGSALGVIWRIFKFNV